MNLEKLMWTALKIRHDVTTPYHPACNSAVETFNKILKHYIATALVNVGLGGVLGAIALRLQHGGVVINEGNAIRGNVWVRSKSAIVGRSSISRGRGSGEKGLCRIPSTGQAHAASHEEIAHHNQQTRTEYTDKYNTANKVVYPRYVAGDKVWVKVMDKNQRSPNPKLAPPWERGTIVQRGVTGTSYKVKGHDRKGKKVKTVNVQQIKPFEM
jgi:hypothetical protein